MTWTIALLAAMTAISVPALDASDHIPHVDTTKTVRGIPTFMTYPGRWQATPVEARAAKNALYGWLSARDRTLLLWDRQQFTDQVNLQDYEMQYIGARINVQTGRFDSRGVKALVIHGVRRTSGSAGEELDHSELVVSDGGDTFFEAYYDVDHDKLLMFTFHGYA